MPTCYETVGFSWNVILAFLRLTTRPGVFQMPLSIEQAFDLVRGWVDHPTALIVHPGPRHFAILRSLLPPLGTGGNLTSDAHLAALLRHHGVKTLYTHDRDFLKFPLLDVRDPFEGTAKEK